MVMEVVHEDMGDGNTQCTNHPYKNTTPGGICPFCLQEKLGKLVSSSFPLPIFPSSLSSSPSPSFRSDPAAGNTTSAAIVRHLPPPSESHCTRRSRLPFVLTQRKKKKKEADDSTSTIVFKRSKSTATPRRRGMNFLDENGDYTPHKRGFFWSFLYTSKKCDKNPNFTPPTRSTVCSNIGGTSIRSREEKKLDFDVNDENGSPKFDRKVSRSRSVGCGSRSFSGDFFERISTGFGDCTLRRVESQREGKSKVQSVMHRNNGGVNGQDCIKERVRCGGLFSGFMITSSSSSSSSSSAEENKAAVSSVAAAAAATHGRSKSWGWAFASPMRAFGKPKRDVANSSKNVAPNLAAIPSLLAVKREG